MEAYNSMSPSGATILNTLCTMGTAALVVPTGVTAIRKTLPAPCTSRQSASIYEVSFASGANTRPERQGVPSAESTQRSSPHQPAIFQASTNRMDSEKSTGLMLAVPAIGVLTFRNRQAELLGIEFVLQD